MGGLFSCILFFPSFVLCEKTIEVHNKLPKGGDKQLFTTTMRLEEDLEIGEEEDENLPILGRISDIVVDSRGLVYVADQAQSMVLVYDDNGSFVRQIGREGEGPGEFNRPDALALDARDELFVADARNVSIFDSTRTFVTRFNQNLGGGLARGMVLCGTEYVFLSCFEVWDQKIIHKFSRDGTKLLSFCESYAAGSGEDFRVEQVYAGGPIDMDPQGRICYSQLTPYQIRKFSDLGSLVMIIDRENEFMVQPEVIRDGDMMRFSMPTASYGFRVLSDGTMINSILVARDDQEIRTMPGSFIDVFRADGQLLGSIAIKPTSWLLGKDAADRLYFVQYSEPITIVRYRLKR
ncbi:MAG: 6-bladed beta-propeller [bacterium]